MHLLCMILGAINVAGNPGKNQGMVHRWRRPMHDSGRPVPRLVPNVPDHRVNAAPPAAAAPALPTAQPISTSLNIAPAIADTTQAKDQICASPDNRVAAAGASPASGQAVAQATPNAGGDPAAGRQVFRKCQACHSIEPGKNILGPSPAGIVGRKSGAEPGCSYSRR